MQVLLCYTYKSQVSWFCITIVLTNKLNSFLKLLLFLFFKIYHEAMKSKQFREEGPELIQIMENYKRLKVNI